MRSRCFASLFLVTSVLAAPASAQDARGCDEPARAPIDGDDDLPQLLVASIDAESSAATGLYVGGVILHAGGALLVPVWMAFGFAACSMDEVGPCWTHDAALGSSIVSAVGLVSIGVAIGLDVDSGSRRAGLAREPSDGVELSLRIGPGGAGLSGRF